MYIVYTEIVNENGVERWFYGLYDTKDKANNVAVELGSNYPTFHCVCNTDSDIVLTIKNLPNNFNEAVKYYTLLRGEKDD